MAEIILNSISLPYDIPEEEALALAAKKLKKHGLPFSHMSVYRVSVDARKQNNIQFVRSIICKVEGDVSDEKLKALSAQSAAAAFTPATEVGDTPLEKRPVVVGFGPAGMFAALVLAERGYRPIVLERGGAIVDRVKAVDEFMRSGRLDTECNVQFGAGGAGTFSDGKLTTRISDPGCRYVLETLVKYGAPEEILRSGKPHIGTEKLREVVGRISDAVVELGGEVRYNTRFDGIRRTDGLRVTSVMTSRGELECGALILATGHSARDTYLSLQTSGLEVRPKAFSVGVRIEQLQTDIDRASYGKLAGHPLLPTADYAFSWRNADGVGVYTFCMCPGGVVIAAASEEGGVVTNGMSDSDRAGVNANAALVVGVSPDDPVAFQRRLERRAFEVGGGDYAAPIQTVGGFLAGKITEPGRVRPSYTRGVVTPARLDEIFEPKIRDMLTEGLTRFERSMRGFAPSDALLTGCETRTSSPYRVTRLDGAFCTEKYENLYPCGEGAGYAGGIMSAACDGIRCASAVVRKNSPKI